jgi:hypothetical protein
MTIYNVHIYRELRLSFECIEANTPEAALRIARAGTTGDADDIADEGEDLSARVEIDGDDAPERALMIQFEPGRKAALRLLAALKGTLYALDENMDGSGPSKRTAIATARAAIAEAEASGIRPADATVLPMVIVEVCGGLIDAVDATIPVHVIVADWDVTDEDTGKKPTRSLWKLTGGLSGPKAEKFRRFIAND